jgi:hypothetical protein
LYTSVDSFEHRLTAVYLDRSDVVDLSTPCL